LAGFGSGGPRRLSRQEGQKVLFVTFVRFADELPGGKLRGIKNNGITSEHFIAPKRQKRKEKHDPISPNLACFASLRESSFGDPSRLNHVSSD
jgi:hypothetical protein